MSDVVIRVENLCKEYRLGTISHGTLYRDIQSGWAKLRGTEDPNARIGAVNREQLNNINDRFSALKDVSFDVRQGEIVGIIGRNGAGKSTLLKIISRVTAPSQGTIKIKGRVASLLEVGTGFHPELTGRENIFLNGAILGMHKGEIEQKFDEIVAFSEIDKFIDTPVKRYSSGMYVRLAFAVAAHLDPEILVVDEVLAVGDAAFQKKCLGKMGDISKEGRTVLFVSHNMGAIRQLCNSCILLEDGQVKKRGQTQNVIDHYLQSTLTSASMNTLKIDDKKEFQLIKVRIIDEIGQEKTECNCDFPIVIEMTFHVRVKIPGIYGYMTINQSDGALVMVSDSFDNEPNSLDNLDPGIHSFHVIIPPRTLGSGNYHIYLNFTSNYNIQSFNVDSPGIVYSFVVFDETSHRGNNRGGYFSTKLKWENREELFPPQERN